MKHTLELKKEFVKYEVAVELKKLGFDEPCLGRWLVVKEWEEPTGEIILQLGTKAEDYDKNQCPAPLFSQAFRFFREKYDLFGCIDLHVSTPLHWYVRIDKISINDYVYHSEDDSKYYANYEDAELACLMKLIKINS